ncbi:hypothetical protein H5410_065002 [Solanum commersonii]|uniref:ATP-dependent DNA helicase n=1 Tax=Solanum commersonii TaxID=4109 RepID=A0A9J5VXU3_SOLCO|nr:hypothetical protein H5410_065002 [Solanum commersonii]
MPIDIDDNFCCNVSKQSPLALLIKDAKLFVWDEASMAKKYMIEALDVLLRDIMDVKTLLVVISPTEQIPEMTSNYSRQRMNLKLFLKTLNLLNDVRRSREYSFVIALYFYFNTKRNNQSLLQVEVDVQQTQILDRPSSEYYFPFPDKGSTYVFALLKSEKNSYGYMFKICLHQHIPNVASQNGCRRVRGREAEFDGP